MNKIDKIKCFLKVFLLIVTLNSCKKDFLEVVPKDQLSSESIFADEKGADIFLNDVYHWLPDQDAGFNPYAYDAFECYADNAVARYNWAVSWQLSISKSYGPDTYNPGLYNHTYPAMPFIWDNIYSFIRKCNLFMEEVNKNSDKFPADWRAKRLAEARFLRAYYYHLAWMAYGGLPIVTKVLNRSEIGNEIFTPRSTFEETGKFIADELALAANDLPNEVGGGRATKGAALTLKGWVELFSHKFAEAAATNKQVMNLGVYALFPNYNSQFLAENNNNKESIFAYQHMAGSKNSLKTEYWGPKGNFGARGQMQPTQSLVDDYVMLNGLPISDPASGYDPLHPYTNRDLRFEQSIIHHGSVFAGETYNMTNGSSYGLDPAKENRTGYFRRKGIDERLKGNRSLDGGNYIFFRYAEVLLNFAEAKIELGQLDQEAIDAIDKVRNRAGLPTLMATYNRALNQAELREIVRRERRVELAFENKRYWDLIRWKTAHIILNQPAYGVKVADNNEQLTLTKVVVHTNEFLQKNYLFPVFQGWIDANPAIKAQNGGPDGFVNGQNPGY